MYQAVLHFLERFGNVVGRFLLTIVYFLAVAPVAVFYRVFADSLMIRKAPASTFRDWEQVNETIDDARRQD